VNQEIETVRAEGLSSTAAQRVELAELTAPGGRIDRAEQRLATMIERLQETESTEAQSGRRFGEDHLPEELITTRRRRERDRRIKQARKRVEDERTALSELTSRARHLEASIEEELSQAEASTRIVGSLQQSQATSYLNGALRKHPDRPLLSALAPELMPSPRPQGPITAQEDQA
jgi:hypothetical protein